MSSLHFRNRLPEWIPVHAVHGANPVRHQGSEDQTEARNYLYIGNSNRSHFRQRGLPLLIFCDLIYYIYI